MLVIQACWWFDGAEPQGVHFWDTRICEYIRVVNGLIESYCPVKARWKDVDTDSLIEYDSHFPLIKNPKAKWKTIQKSLGSYSLYLKLYERAKERRCPPFLRVGRRVIALSKHLSWWQKLYLCYFRDFNRDVTQKEFYFIKRV